MANQNPARIPPQTPPAGGKSVEAKRKILSPRKTDFRFAESALKPHALPEYLEGRTPKEKHPFLFQKKFHPRQIRNARSVFSFGVAGVLDSAWGFLRAYASVSLHHARGACEVICFGNRCEFGTIDTHFKPSTVNQNKTLLAYVVGVAVGDGNLSRPNGRCTRLRVTCDLKYPLLIEKIQSALQALLPENKIRIISRHPDKCVDVSCYSNWWEEWLPWKVGQGSKVQQSAHVPDWIMQHEKYIKACLCGLIETDGSVYMDRGYKMVNFTTVIPELAEDVIEMIKVLGFQPRVYKIRGPKRYKYVVRIAKDVNRFIWVVGIDKS